MNEELDAAMTKKQRLAEIDSFDVALSFAGEDRPLVAQVARGLTKEGLMVFYDDETNCHSAALLTWRNTRA